MKYRHATRRLNHQKVLLAVYWTADAGGLSSSATDAEIGAAAGLNGDTAGSYVGELECDGTIAVFRNAGFGLTHRTMILLDHPDAQTACRRMLTTRGRSGYPT